MTSKRSVRSMYILGMNTLLTRNGYNEIPLEDLYEEFDRFIGKTEADALREMADLLDKKSESIMNKDVANGVKLSIGLLKFNAELVEQEAQENDRG